MLSLRDAHRIGDEKAAAEVMRAGALDYLVKSAETMEFLPQIVERTLRQWNNIQRRREAEEALRISEAKYRNLFDNMSDAVALDELILDAGGKAVDWKVIEANPAYETIYGISREEAVGRLASELYAGRFEYGPILEAADDALSKGLPQQAEFYFSGSAKYLLVSIFPLGGRRFATLGRDITERRRGEIERERLLAELEATINAIADAVMIYGPEGEIRRMNPAAREKFGYSSDNREKPMSQRLAGYRFESPDGDLFPIREIMQRVVAGQRMEGMLMVMRRPDGREIWLSNSAAPIRTADGQLVGAVATSTDITELHRLQEERDQYLHTISHDLRLPLTVIRGYSQLLEESLGQEKERGDQVSLMLNELSAGVSRMSRMIDDLVEMARLEGGKVSRQTACLRLGLVMEGLRRRIADGVDWTRLQAELPADLPSVEADPDHLERILLNLLTNACKYSSAEEPVRLAAHREGSELLISVIDRGEGIDPKDQPHIFERFYRTGRAARRDSVGLGLYITRKLVETNGGRIRVESAPGKGSTFAFTLPVA